MILISRNERKCRYLQCKGIREGMSHTKVNDNASTGASVRSNVTRHTPPRCFRPRYSLPPVTHASPVTLAPSRRSPRTSRTWSVWIHDSRVARPAHCGHPLPRPHPARTLPLLSPSLALYLTSNDSRVSPLASSPTPNAVGMPCHSRPRWWPLGARAGAPQVVLAEPWAPTSAPGCWWCLRVSAHRWLPPWWQESVSPGLPFLMLQTYISSVSEVSETCCICFI
jgi:hypothetical protein